MWTSRHHSVWRERAKIELVHFRAPAARRIMTAVLVISVLKFGISRHGENKARQPADRIDPH
jgi:hypothetical protein